MPYGSPRVGGGIALLDSFEKHGVYKTLFVTATVTHHECGHILWVLACSATELQVNRADCRFQGILLVTLAIQAWQWRLEGGLWQFGK
jgi:hypothetical protein